MRLGCSPRFYAGPSFYRLFSRFHLGMSNRSALPFFTKGLLALIRSEDSRVSPVLSCQPTSYPRVAATYSCADDGGPILDRLTSRFCRGRTLPCSRMPVIALLRSYQPSSRLLAGEFPFTIFRAASPFGLATRPLLLGNPLDVRLTPGLPFAFY